MIRDQYFLFCPHCGQEIVISKASLDEDVNVFNIHCKHCKNEIQVTVEYQPVFYAIKVEEKICMECGTPVKTTSLPQRKVRKYADVPDEEYCLCNSCNTKLMMGDISNESFQFILHKSRR